MSQVRQCYATSGDFHKNVSVPRSRAPLPGTQETTKHSRLTLIEIKIPRRQRLARMLPRSDIQSVLHDYTGFPHGYDGNESQYPPEQRAGQGVAEKMVISGNEGKRQ